MNEMFDEDEKPAAHESGVELFDDHMKINGTLIIPQERNQDDEDTLKWILAICQLRGFTKPMIATFIRWTKNLNGFND